MQRVFLRCIILCLALTGNLLADGAQASEARRLALFQADKSGGKPLMEALSLRAAVRSFGDKAVSDQELSNLLWATWGVNRPDGRRTAPTANNTQNVEVYVARGDGVWLYAGERHELVQVLGEDIRFKLGGAPLTLIYVSQADNEFSGMHVGALFQNAGLYCASAGLNNVVKRTGASAAEDILNLPTGYKVFAIHMIGWPK